MDVVVFAVKLYDSETAAAAIIPLVGPATKVITLQNGIDSVATLAKYLPRPQIVPGATYLSASIKQPGVILHAHGNSKTILGGPNDPVVEALGNASARVVGLDIQIVDDIDHVLWAKFITVSAFSGATSLMRCGIGPIIANPESRIFLEQLRDEGMAVAAAAGHKMVEGYEGAGHVALEIISGRNKILDGNRPRKRKTHRDCLALGPHPRAGERTWCHDPRPHGGLSCAAPPCSRNPTLIIKNIRLVGRQTMAADLDTTKVSPLAGGDDTYAVFNEQLSTYRKIVGENLMYHREVYAPASRCAFRINAEPFTFLDIACGDASASVKALKDTSIAHYFGIDLSAKSLELARENLKVLSLHVRFAMLRFCRRYGGLDRIG